MPLSQVGRILALVCISLTLYGGGCVFIVLISQLLGSLVANAGTIKRATAAAFQYETYFRSTATPLSMDGDRGLDVDPPHLGWHPQGLLADCRGSSDHNRRRLSPHHRRLCAQGH